MPGLLVYGRLLALIGITVLVAAGCGAVEGEREVACSVVGEVRFSESFLRGPDQSRERFAATALGRVVDDFFMAGPGVEENEMYREAEGFSPVSDTLALGYVAGTLTSYFRVEEGRMAGWGGCSPNLLEGDLVAVRWLPVRPVDPEATTLAIEVLGGGCVTDTGTETMTEISRIDVSESDEVVEITVWARETPFIATCAGVGLLLPAVATLDVPLGERALIDAGVIPGRAVDR